MLLRACGGVDGISLRTERQQMIQFGTWVVV